MKKRPLMPLIRTLAHPTGGGGGVQEAGMQGMGGETIHMKKGIAKGKKLCVVASFEAWTTRKKKPRGDGKIRLGGKSRGATGLEKRRSDTHAILQNRTSRSKAWDKAGAVRKHSKGTNKASTLSIEAESQEGQKREAFGNR